MGRSGSERDAHIGRLVRQLLCGGVAAMKQQGMRSPLARAIGLGSAKDGVEHWWLQRLTAVALMPLTVWFVASIIAHTGRGSD